MIVLAIDTSGATSAAAVLAADLLFVAAADSPRGHARVLPGLMVQAAMEAGVALAEVTHVAVARGPGLFTGMRVGLVSAEMFAMARGLPLAGVSTLQAAANRVVHRHAPAAPFAVLLDARRREVFAQAFGAAGTPLDEPRALTAQALRGESGLPAAVAEDAVFVDIAAAALGIPGIPLRTDGLAGDVALVAARRWLAGAAAEPATPLYLRRPDTTPANPARSVLGQR